MVLLRKRLTYVTLVNVSPNPGPCAFFDKMGNKAITYYPFVLDVEMTIKSYEVYTLDCSSYS